MSFLNFRENVTRIPYLVRIFFIIDISVTLLYVFNYLLGEPSWLINKMLNVDGETSLSSWYSSIQLFCIFIFGAIFVHEKSKEEKTSSLLIGLPLIFLFMSIDETIQFHEYLGKKSDVLLSGGTRTGTIFPETGIWMFIFGIPFLILFLIWIYSIRKYISEHPSSFKKLIFGMVILLIGALFLDLVGNYTYAALDIIELSLEEFFEMIGATVMLWGVYDMAKQYFPDLIQERANPSI